MERRTRNQLYTRCMIDQVIVELASGPGGKGAVSFHREKFVTKGGPDGGRGGRGGHVIAIASGQTNTLLRYRRQRSFRAQSGQPGGTSNRRGRDGEDLILEVPAGTIISRLRRDGSVAEVVADLADDGAGTVVARGGRGGHGNAYFKSSTNSTPRVAQQGQSGDGGSFRLELRLIADVGIVGLPNTGKSTLLQQLSAAQPRVAAYPFTTLEPHLGVVQAGWEEFVLADLPGLIEGAAEGAGLGHEFLRHTGRTRVLIHLVDGMRDDPVGAYDAINRELEAYDPKLAAKPQVLAVNKLDTEEVVVLRDEIAALFAARDLAPLFISAQTGEGTDGVVDQALEVWRAARAADEEVRRQRPAAPIVIQPRPDSRRYEVQKLKDGSYRVRGRQVETFIEMMDMKEEGVREEAYRWLSRRGVSGALRKAGLEPGDLVRVGWTRWTWEA